MLAAVLAAIGVANATPQPQPSPQPCSAPAHRAFDFWVGDWSVYDTATRKPVGHNLVTRIQGGCAVQEHWTGADGSTGTSFNMYYTPDRQWHQTWVDSSGLLLRLDGGVVDGKMVLSGRRLSRRGTWVTDRIVWTPEANGDVRQVWQLSPDGGKTWQPVFDGTYVRAH